MSINRRMLALSLGMALLHSAPVSAEIQLTDPLPKIDKKNSFATQRQRDKQRRMEKKARRR